MTYKEENIVNISMVAAELLKDGRIERDDISGHSGLTDVIIALAEHFEKEHAEIDWDSGDRDYWEEIDSFAEKELLERYGCERNSREHGLNIKVIVSDGVVEGALKNADVPVSVEIVDVAEFYDNYETRKAYRDTLYKDPTLMPCDCDFVDPEEIETELSIDTLPEDPVTVYAVAGRVKHEIFSGNFDECKAFCEEHHWCWVDENEFEWGMEIEDSREDLLPALGYILLDRELFPEENSVSSHRAPSLVDIIEEASTCVALPSSVKKIQQER